MTEETAITTKEEVSTSSGTPPAQGESRIFGMTLRGFIVLGIVVVWCGCILFGITVDDFFKGTITSLISAYFGKTHSAQAQK